MRETGPRGYQSRVIRRLMDDYPNAIVMKNDPGYIQGIPDILILYNDRWAMLEVKGSFEAKFEANQEYYLDVLSKMSFAARIYPEIEDRVFYELQQALCDRRPPRVSKSKLVPLDQLR